MINCDIKLSIKLYGKLAKKRRTKMETIKDLTTNLIAIDKDAIKQTSPRGIHGLFNMLSFGLPEYWNSRHEVINYRKALSYNKGQFLLH